MKKLTIKEKQCFSHAYVLTCGTVAIIFKDTVKGNNVEWANVYPFLSKRHSITEDLYTNNLEVAMFLIREPSLHIAHHNAGSQSTQEGGLKVCSFNVCHPNGKYFDCGLNFPYLPELWLGDIQLCKGVVSKYQEGDYNVRGSYPIQKVITSK